MPRASPGRFARRGVEFHRQHEAALLVRLHGANADDLAGHFVAALVADRQHHAVLPCGPLGRGAEGAFDPQWRQCGRGLGLRARFEAQVVAAAGADRRAPAAMRQRRSVRLISPPMAIIRQPAQIQLAKGLI